MLQPLNLPSFEANVKKSGGMVKIMDILRHKFIALTPEEWVRQHFVHFMILHKGTLSVYVKRVTATKLVTVSTTIFLNLKITVCYQATRLTI